MRPYSKTARSLLESAVGLRRRVHFAPSHVGSQRTDLDDLVLRDGHEIPGKDQEICAVVEMVMVIRQAGYDRGPLEIDQPGIRACERADCSVRPDGGVFIAPDGKRLRNRKV